MSPVAQVQERSGVEPFAYPDAAAEVFARCRELFTRHGYTEAQLCERGRVETMADFEEEETARARVHEGRDAQALLFRMFFEAEALPEALLQEAFSADELHALAALGLTTSAGAPDGHLLAAVLVYPTQGVLIASDVAGLRAPSGAKLAEDVVYPAITRNTQLYMSMMPRSKCDALLELCSGTGIAALVGAAEFSTHAWAVDITARSVACARFNAALNGLSNVTVLQGDLYEAVAGRQFDLIVAHPPYVPALQTEYIFRDGGENGEEITRRIIAGLPRHLRPGGKCFIAALLMDPDDASLHQRIRGMLGDAQQEFDLVVAVSGAFDLLRQHVDRFVAGSESLEVFTQWCRLLGSLKVSRFVLASMLLVRHETARAPVDVARRISPFSKWQHMRWVMRWERETGAWTGGDVLKLMSSRPRLSPHVQLHGRMRLAAGQWAVQDATVSTSMPFAVEVNVPPWAGPLLTWCDGTLTAREHLEHLQDSRADVADLTPEGFATTLKDLVGHGILVLDELPFPHTPGGD